MIRSARSVALLFARVGAVAFALTACGYLVVTAQRRANPPPAEPASDDALTTDIAPAAPGETFLQGSKSLVLEPTDVVATEEDGSVAETEFGTVFLSSSKTLNWTPQPNPPPLVFPPIDAKSEPAPVPNHAFLYSSKSGAVSVRPPLLPGTVPMDGSLPMPGPHANASSTSTSATPGGGTAPPVGPVFLPSSKAKAPLTQKELEALIPGKVTSSRRVFLPSSKSLRLGETSASKPAPVPAPVPVDPPKNP